MKFVAQYDIVVIGSGPTGMIAAGRAGELGASVLLIEKNQTPGAKLLITGKNRCNITNKSDDIKEMISTYGKNGKFLFSSFHRFSPDDIIDFLKDRGVEIKVERGNRVFPISDSSLDVLNVFVNYLKQSKVKFKNKSTVKKIIRNTGFIEKIILNDDTEITANKFIICTGGKSYPKTGSTGDGYKWLSKMGHTIIEPSPALSPIILKENFIQDLEGLSLKNIQISAYKNNKKIDSKFGEALFTKNGMSGPIILDLSKKINKALPNNVIIKIDFKPALDTKKLDLRIQEDFKNNSNKFFQNSLNQLLPKKIIPTMIKLSGINPEKKVNEITRDERKKLTLLLKEFTLEVKSIVGYEKAIITTGGVKLSEVDPKTMKSKIIKNLYLAGEILDLDGPTGGYNLQICWSTGFIAGESAANQ